MSEVDVSNVRVAKRGDGISVFVADSLSYKIAPDNTMWLSLRDANGECFAVARVTEERAATFLTDAMIEIGANMADARDQRMAQRREKMNG